MTFFTPAWVARALGSVQWAGGSRSLHAAMEWLVGSDRNGKYFDYQNMAHNFATTDALWACRAFRRLTAECTVEADGGMRLGESTGPKKERYHEPVGSPGKPGVRRRRKMELAGALSALSQVSDPHRRGKELEGILNALFVAEGISVRTAFTIGSEVTGQTVEQIDGAIEVDGHLFLVEMKWWAKKLSKADIANHLIGVLGRADCGGIVISKSGFLESAVAAAKGALATRTVVLVEVNEIVGALTKGIPLVDVIRTKVTAARLDMRPLTYPLDVL